MGELGDPAICIDSNIAAILATQGVEFLLSGEGKVPLSSCGGKTICLFFSANWCRPCRTFCPQLVQLYNSLNTKYKNLEIIFVSFDHDDDGFKEHFKSMPWLAVPFETNLHKQLSSIYHVDRIPSLISLSLDGLSVGEDLIGLIEDYGDEAFPFTKHRKEELKAMDDAKRHGGKLEDLLALQGRDYVISTDAKKISASELVDKTIGLYFGGHWCPPSRAFTKQLIQAYNDLKTSTTTEQFFEIVFVSTDRDCKEFDLNLSSMPWLAIPYQDRTRQDLCRIFNVKGIPALVIVGPDGKTVTNNGKSMIALYGAKAYPFTESRIASLEGALEAPSEGYKA